MSLNPLEINLRMRRDRVLMSSECWKNELRILLGYCMIVLRTLKQISTIFGSVVGDSVRFRRTSSVPNLSRSWTFDSVPFAKDPMMIATFNLRWRGLLSFCNKAISLGTKPCSMMNRFCLLLPMIRFLIFVVASKHSASSSENRLSKYDLKLSTSYKIEDTCKIFQAFPRKMREFSPAPRKVRLSTMN